MTHLQLDDLDQKIVLLLSDDGRASYSEMSKTLNVSIGTIRNRMTRLREAQALHLNVWLDPYRVGLGITATFLIRVHAGQLEEVADALIALDSTGYIAAIAGDHDLMVDAFCYDLSDLNRVLRDEIESIEGVAAVTSYLVTEIKYESRTNLAAVLAKAKAHEAFDAPSSTRPT